MSLFVWTGCSHQPVYERYYDVSHQTWDMNDTARFEVEMTDTLGHYDVLLHIRHTNDYPYQNLWLFTRSMAPDSSLAVDTLSCYLADNTGQWLSDQTFSTFDMPLLYMENIRFPKKGMYQFEIRQGMRDSLLQGIRNIGLSIVKKEDVQE